VTITKISIEKWLKFQWKTMQSKIMAHLWQILGHFGLTGLILSVHASAKYSKRQS